MSPATRPRPRLILCDDHLMVLEGIKSLLESKYDVVAITEDGGAALRAVQELHPDIVLLDISMPGLNGIETARQIRNIDPNTKVIFLTMHLDSVFVHEALRAGAAGYVVKRTVFRELTTAIDDVSQGKMYITPLVTGTYCALNRSGK